MGAGRPGLFLGGAAISEFYFFGQPQFDYPADFLNNPRPESVYNPETVEIDSLLMKIGYDQPEEEGRWALTLEQFLIFDCTCWEAMGEGTDIFSDIGWRPLLKAAISRTDVRPEKREALRLFHEEFAHMCQK